MLKNRIKNILKNQMVLIILILLFVLLIIISPSFGDPQNFLNLIKKITIMGIIACGLTLTIINGDLDLSVGSTFSLAGVIAIMLQPYGLILALTMPILACILVGFINGFITTKFKVNSIIVTLGMLSVIKGIALITSNGRNQLGQLGHPYSKIAQTEFFGIPSYVFIFIVIAIVLYIILQKTTFGRFIYLTGSNAEAAKISGIKTDKVRITTFIICAVCAGIASILLSSRMTAATPYSGDGFEFEAITAALIGGNSLAGGKGGIYNTVLGVLLVAVLGNGMLLLGLPFAVQELSRGLLIIVAIFIDQKLRKKEFAI